MSFDSIWARVQDISNFSRQKELANFLGIKDASVSGAKSRGNFPPEWAFKVASHFKVSTDWLLTGEGEKSRKPLLGDIDLQGYDAPPDKAPRCREGIEGAALKFDATLLRVVIKTVEDEIIEQKIVLDSDKKAELISLLYEIIAEEESGQIDKARVSKMIRLAS